MKKRVHEIDILKGIGALLVIIGHLCDYNGVLKIYIYAFHMPLFFFLSGYIFKKKKDIKTSEYIKKKIKTILVPYFIFNIVSLVISLRFGSYEFSGYKNIIKGLFYLEGYVYWNSSLWFLPVIFWCYIIMYFICDLDHINKLKYVLTFLLIAIYIATHSIIMPFGLHVVPMAMVFFLIGNMCFEKITYNKHKIILSSLGFAIFAYFNKRVNMSTNVYNDYIFYVIAAISAIYLLYILSTQHIKKNSILENFGQFSLYMFCTQRMLYTIYGYYGIQLYGNNIKTNVSMMILTIIIYYLIIKIINFLKGEHINVSICNNTNWWCRKKNK